MILRDRAGLESQRPVVAATTGLHGAVAIARWPGTARMWRPRFGSTTLTAPQATLTGGTGGAGGASPGNPGAPGLSTRTIGCSLF